MASFKFKVPEVLREFAVAGVVDWWRDLSETQREQRKVLLQEDKRPALLDDIRYMDARKRQILLRRIQQAERGAIPEELGGIHKLTENALVHLLTQIVTDEDGRRTSKLEWLADLPEEEFWHYMDLLWHNPVQQEIGQVFSVVIPTANRVAELAGQVSESIGEILSQAGLKADEEKVSESLDVAIEWLDSHGVKRHQGRQPKHTPRHARRER
jgi:hypothetical protein